MWIPIDMRSTPAATAQYLRTLLEKDESPNAARMLAATKAWTRRYRGMRRALVEASRLLEWAARVYVRDDATAEKRQEMANHLHERARVLKTYAGSSRTPKFL